MQEKRFELQVVFAATDRVVKDGYEDVVTDYVTSRLADIEEYVHCNINPTQVFVVKRCYVYHDEDARELLTEYRYILYMGLIFKNGTDNKTALIDYIFGILVNGGYLIKLDDSSDGYNINPVWIQGDNQGEDNEETIYKN